MVTKTKALLQVKVLDKRIMKQIQVAPYEPYNKPDAIHWQTYQELQKQPDESAVSVIGWVAGSCLDSARAEFWLVRFKGTYYFIMPPDSGPVYELHRPGMEQLFV